MNTFGTLEHLMYVCIYFCRSWDNWQIRCFTVYSFCTFNVICDSIIFADIPSDFLIYFWCKLQSLCFVDLSTSNKALSSSRSRIGCNHVIRWRRSDSNSNSSCSSRLIRTIIYIFFSCNYTYCSTIINVISVMVALVIMRIIFVVNVLLYRWVRQKRRWQMSLMCVMN